ncbi:hypothetical protein [Flavobacterium sedimenticola]|uniref:Uncharacterized protein n=1 Tax=Flavobacterium sedimenticola TaxID=3043286 RepID=A0ABT6XRL5_9FLAO|nr:hypothetical protein [Flavobacterium sedimenticola]MDI9257299.1 hypothetical protein [Flavobacterium sedimenticola]
MKPEDLPNEKPTEDEVTRMMIDFQIYKAKQNQKEFIKALDDFFKSI